MSITAPSVTVIDTGVANTASVRAAFERLGCRVALTDDPVRARAAALLVLPGVGSFDAGMRALRSTGLDGVITERCALDRPLLGICLGLQLLCASSEEAPGVPGLGVIHAGVTRLPRGVRTPQHGWNRVGALGGLGPGYAYYSNTYRLESVPSGWDGATSDHGGPFVAAVRRGAVMACQFHPELSGAWGARLLGAWVEHAKEEALPC